MNNSVLVFSGPFRAFKSELQSIFKLRLQYPREKPLLAGLNCDVSIGSFWTHLLPSRFQKADEFGGEGMMDGWLIM